MPITVKDLLSAANAAVPKLAADEVKAVLAGDVLLLDVRDGTEVAASGKIKGALAVSRGMLEFRADPASPYYLPELRQDRSVLVYCASGGRSALSGKTLQDMGYTRVFNAGGFKDLVAAGLEVEPA